jgi:hypothetical protein
VQGSRTEERKEKEEKRGVHCSRTEERKIKEEKRGVHCSREECMVNTYLVLCKFLH